MSVNYLFFLKQYNASFFFLFSFFLFFASGVGSPLYPEFFLLYYTIILQRIRIIVGDAGFEPGNSAPEVWCATDEPPHLQPMSHCISPMSTTSPR